MVEAKINDWFDFKGQDQLVLSVQTPFKPDHTEFAVYKWLRANTLERLSFRSSADNSASSPSESAWQERKEAESALQSYLSDIPSMYQRSLSL